MFGYVSFARRCIRSVDAYASTRSHSFPFVSRRLGGFWLFGRSWCRWLVSGSPCPRGARSPWLGRALVWLVVAGSRSVSVGSLAGSWVLGCSVPWFSLRRVEMNASPSCPIVLNGSDGGLVGFARRSCGVVPWGPCRVLLSGSLVPVCLPSVSLRRPRACPPFVSCLGSLPGPAFRGLGFWFLSSGFLGRLCFSLFLCLVSFALSLLRRSLVSRASWPLLRLLVFEPLFLRGVLRAPLSPRTGAFRTWIFVLLATLGCECPCRIRFSISLLSASLAPCVRFRFSPLKCCPHALNEACSCFSFLVLSLD